MFIFTFTMAGVLFPPNLLCLYYPYSYSYPPYFNPILSSCILITSRLESYLFLFFLFFLALLALLTLLCFGRGCYGILVER